MKPFVLVLVYIFFRHASRYGFCDKPISPASARANAAFVRAFILEVGVCLIVIYKPMFKLIGKIMGETKQYGRYSHARNLGQCCLLDNNRPQQHLMQCMIHRMCFNFARDSVLERAGEISLFGCPLTNHLRVQSLWILRPWSWSTSEFYRYYWHQCHCRGGVFD